MWGFSTFRTACVLLAELAGVSKALAFETAKGVRDEDANGVTDMTGKKRIGQSSCFECDHEQVGVFSLAVTEGGQAANV